VAADDVLYDVGVFRAAPRRLDAEGGDDVKDSFTSCRSCESFLFRSSPDMRSSLETLPAFVTPVTL